MEVWGKGLMRMWPLLESSNSGTLRFLVCYAEMESEPTSLPQPASSHKQANARVTHCS